MFEDVGYVAARLDVIADRAGFTKGAVYSNFGSKQELFATLLADRLADISTDVLAGSAAFTSVDDLVQYTARRLANDIITERAWHALVVEFTLQAARDAEVGETYRTERVNRRAILAAGIASRVSSFGGSDDPATYLVFATVLLATINGLSVELAADPDAMTEQDVVDSLAAVLAAAIPSR